MAGSIKRDYMRCFITKFNKEIGVVFNASKLNSIAECEKYVLDIVNNLKAKPKAKAPKFKEYYDLTVKLEKIKRDKQIYYWIALVTSCLALGEFIIIAGARL